MEFSFRDTSSIILEPLILVKTKAQVNVLMLYSTWIKYLIEMKKKFYRTYDQLFDIYPEDSLAYRIEFIDNKLTKEAIRELREFKYQQENYVTMMRKTITLYEIEKEIQFRPDAKLFLVINFNEMIVKPLIFRQLENEKETSPKDLFITIQLDLIRVMNHAVEFKQNDEDISGHRIMKSIDELWGKLDSTKYELWG